ncbi:hypothetical protein MIND_01088900 [Mycena indigotica]|uniref:DUF6534 domain-containing protein n=1 Tax=Mycena indigotica TaxID=2126181 RepID=A0A8H6S9I9_9AGAR|nr:uncharacterized protein MIND_01088900 [Mycena indigotica]KAF7295490.1 hypothetical protein MIND_01088900 [Mycena indigotica]
MDHPLRTLNLDLGSLQIGFLASGFLFGALTVQVLIYNRKFVPTDSWPLRTLVFGIYVLELGQLGCVSHALYSITITRSGDITAMLSPPRTVGVSFLLGSAVGPLVEAFYVSRLLRFSGKLSVALVGWGLAFARWCGWVFIAVHVIITPSLSRFIDTFGWLLAMLLGMSAVIDLAISAWIAYFLAQRRSRAKTSTKFVSSSSAVSRLNLNSASARQLLDRVILWTLQTGVITSLSFLVTLVCYLVLGEYLIWMAVLAILTKVSSNSFLASLNARASTQLRRPNDILSRSRGQSGSHHPGTASNQLNTGHSVVNNIIDLYQLGSRQQPECEETEGDADSHFYMQSLHRSTSRASFTGANGDVYDRSAFSPDGTIVSAKSATPSRRSGYWAL